MAKEIGVSINTYADKENGKRDFTRKEMQKYISILEENGIKIELSKIFYP